MPGTDISLPPLSQLDAELAQLRAENPGWRFWYVPHAVDGSVTWCAQPLPLLNCGSPKELREEIAEARREAVAFLGQVPAG